MNVFKERKYITAFDSKFFTTMTHKTKMARKIFYTVGNNVIPRGQLYDFN
jgi:hypothetical protein